jgi:hypothetical protein
MTSRQTRCCGVIHTKAKCRLSRADLGIAIAIKGQCGKCHEKRCEAHCRCGRTGMATGRHMSMGVGVAAKAQLKAKAKTVARTAARPARPPNALVNLFDDGSWFETLLLLAVPGLLRLAPWLYRGY